MISVFGVLGGLGGLGSVAGTSPDAHLPILEIMCFTSSSSSILDSSEAESKMSIVACELDRFRLTNLASEPEEPCGSRRGAASALEPPNSSKHDVRIFSADQTAGPPAGLCTKPRLGGRRSPI